MAPTTRHDGEAEAVTQHDAIIDVPIDWPSAEPRYRVTVGLRDAGDRFECARLEIAATADDPIGSAVMRSLPVGSLISEAIHRLLSGMLAGTGARVAAQSLDAQDIQTDMVRLNARLAETAASSMERISAGASSEPAAQELARLQASSAISSEAAARKMSRLSETVPNDMSQIEAHWQVRAAELSEQLGSPVGFGNGRRYPPGHLEAVADTVREARRRGDPAVIAVATVFGVTKSAAASQITRARALGLLEHAGDRER